MTAQIKLIPVIPNRMLLFALPPAALVVEAMAVSGVGLGHRRYRAWGADGGLGDQRAVPGQRYSRGLANSARQPPWSLNTSHPWTFANHRSPDSSRHAGAGADGRGLWSPRLWRQIRALGLHPLMRVKINTTFQLDGGCRLLVNQVLPGPGYAWVGQGNCSGLS